MTHFPCYPQYYFLQSCQNSSPRKHMFLLAHLCWRTFRWEEHLQLSDRNFILVTQNLSGISSEALIGRWSSYIVSAIVYERQTKGHKGQSKRDECITKQSIFLEYVLSWKKHLSFAGACSQMNTTLYQNRPGETQN